MMDDIKETLEGCVDVKLYDGAEQVFNGKGKPSGIEVVGWKPYLS